MVPVWGRGTFYIEEVRLKVTTMKCQAMGASRDRIAVLYVTHQRPSCGAQLDSDLMCSSLYRSDQKLCP